MHGHEQWFRIAHEDLAAARGMLKLELFSTVTYHCQQAAEKALKGYLAFKNQPIEKTHDLVRLIEFCKKFDHSFTTLYEAADHINPFVARFRYPTEFEVPSHADAEIIMKYAKTIYRFALKKIVEPSSGQGNLFDID